MKHRQTAERTEISEDKRKNEYRKRNPNEPGQANGGNFPDGVKDAFRKRIPNPFALGKPSIPFSPEPAVARAKESH